MAKRKAHLTPKEKLICAAANILFDVDQHVLAFIFGVNQGRVNPAVKAVRRALGISKRATKQKARAKLEKAIPKLKLVASK
jgi:hypothetical protein